LDLYKEALRIHTDLGDQPNSAKTLNAIGAIYNKKGEYEQAKTYYGQALQLRQKLNVPTDIAETLHNLGETDQNLGQFDSAMDKYHQALDLRRKGNDKKMAAYETGALGSAFGGKGRYGAALSSQEDAVKTFRELGEKSTETIAVLWWYGEALAQVGKKTEAAASLQEALSLANESTNKDEVAWVQALQGDNAFYSGDLKAARQFYSQATQSAAHSGDPRLQLTCKFNLARLSVSEGSAQAGLTSLKAVADQASKLGLRYLASESSLYAGQALIQLKKFADARALLQNVVLQAEKFGWLALKAQGHALTARALKLEGKAAEAERERKMAEQLFGEIEQEGHFKLEARYDFASMMQ